MVFIDNTKSLTVNEKELYFFEKTFHFKNIYAYICINPF